jgi:ATP-binding cassette, subfamily B, bacterial
MTHTSNILANKLEKWRRQLPYLPRSLGLLWDAARGWTIVWIVLLVIQGILPAAIIYLTKLIVDGVVAALRSTGTTSPKPVLILVALLAVTTLILEVVRSLTVYVRTAQAELLQDHISSLIHEKSVSADLAFYDLADYYDHLHRARSEATYRPVALIENLGALLQNSLTLVALGTLLIPLGLWLSLILVLSTLPAFFVVLRYSLIEREWRQSITAEERRSWYYDWLMTSAEAAAELRLFDLGKHFQSSYQTIRRKLRTERLTITRRQSVAELFASITALIITALALAWMVYRALNGRATLGELTLIAAAFSQGQRLMRTLLENTGQLYTNSLFLGHLYEFLQLRSDMNEVDPADAEVPQSDCLSVSFKDVHFKYPLAESYALESFTLEIKAGKIVALVGPNGAGKSTLVKLLCRYYDPQSGSIEVDGIDLKSIPTASLRKLVTVLFQQPFHYNTTVRENIQYGDHEGRQSLGEIADAAKAAGAEEIVAELPDHYETILGKSFIGGTELSVGEWQRIALARAFVRKAPIIVLDEPTSSLDPWSEADWQKRFRKLASNRTAIVITHRFTTAMHADLIHVMDRGKVVESGTHQQLLDRGGPYADSWSKQMLTAEAIGSSL